MFPVTGILMWFVMGVICFVLGLMTPGFVLLLFAIGAWITALVCWLAPVAIVTQLAIFLGSSLLLLALLRGLQKTFPRKPENDK